MRSPDHGWDSWQERIRQLKAAALEWLDRARQLVLEARRKIRVGPPPSTPGEPIRPGGEYDPEGPPPFPPRER